MLKTNKIIEKKKTMKNDIILFAVMFAVAWIGFTVAKDRLPPTSTATNGVATNDVATNDVATESVATESVSADAVSSIDQSVATSRDANPTSGSPQAIDKSPLSSDDSPATSSAVKMQKESALPANTGSAEPKTTEQSIEQVLTDQTIAWNLGDLDAFMDAYWNDESLTFSGGGDTTLGWEATYESYRQRYPVGAMGKIEFKDLKTEMVGKESAIVTGRFTHQLPDEKVKGNFSLVVKIIDGQWKIIHDHTSVAN